MKKPEPSAPTNRNSRPNKPEALHFRYPRRAEENRGECRGAKAPLARGRSRDRRGLVVISPPRQEVLR